MTLAAAFHRDLSLDPLFAAFTPWRGWAPAGFDVDFLGQVTALSFIDGATDAARMKDRMAWPSYPQINDEIFEWRSLLSAVISARGSFTMVEAGAGYGRWLVAGALAARQKALSTTLVGIEAEPTHFDWLKAHVAANGIASADCRLINAPVAGSQREVIFAGGRPLQWWGQAIVGSVAEAGDANPMPMISIALTEILAPLPHVDLVDMDIQGAELEVVTATTRALDQKIKRVHISTHSPVIEAGLRDLFSSLGWSCLWDFAGQGKRGTPYGELDFADGVQSWGNPRFQ